ncbi:MAG: hypothetical protein H7X95_12130 [Deltaproteobacteria bacterium]|nr:hypothetical protein [Deltaproteobacteria bacterium]
MTPSRPQRIRFAAVVPPIVLGLLLLPLGQRPVAASPTVSAEVNSQSRPGSLNLRLNQGAATRVFAELSGAAQESDTEKPKPMEGQGAATDPASPQAAAVKKAPPPPEDKFAFVKDWPFWVIVGGVVIAGVGGYMLLRNSNQDAPCAPQFNAGCFP